MKNSMKKIEVNADFISKNFFDYDEREIFPLDENCDYGKGYNFLLAVYDSFFADCGMFKSKEDFLKDLDDHAPDGSWDTELIVADNGKFFIEVSNPYDYDGDVEEETFEVVGDLEPLKAWVKDGLDYVKSLD